MDSVFNINLNETELHFSILMISLVWLDFKKVGMAAHPYNLIY